MATAHRFIALLVCCFLAVVTAAFSPASYAVGYAWDRDTASAVNLSTLDAEYTRLGNPLNAGIHCYSDDHPCYGISRQVAADGMNWFCNYFVGKVYVDSSTYTVGEWYYKPSRKYQTKPTELVYEEGQVHYEIVTVGKCDPNVIMNSVTCFNNLMATIDSCDTMGENGKHGGTATSGCLQYQVQPNPLYWPNCKIGA